MSGDCIPSAPTSGCENTSSQRRFSSETRLRKRVERDRPTETPQHRSSMISYASNITYNFLFHLSFKKNFILVTIKHKSNAHYFRKLPDLESFRSTLGRLCCLFFLGVGRLSRSSECCHRVYAEWRPESVPQTAQSANQVTSLL